MRTCEAGYDAAAAIYCAYGGRCDPAHVELLRWWGDKDTLGTYSGCIPLILGGRGPETGCPLPGGVDLRVSSPTGRWAAFL